METNTLRVLVFTNWGKFCNFSPSITERVDGVDPAPDWENDYPDSNNPIVQCIDDAGPAKLQPVDDFSSPGVYLVYDGISQDQLNPLLNPLEQSDDSVLILYHTHGYNNKDGNGFFTENQRDKFFIRQGAHNNLEASLYYSLFKTLTDSTTDKIKRIKDWACKKMIDIARRNLQQDFGSCGNPDVGTPRFIRDYSFICSRREIVKDCAKSLYEKYKTSQNGNDYMLEYNAFINIIKSL